MKPPFSVIFFGTPSFARHHLQVLLDSDLFKVVGVVTQPAKPFGRKLKTQPREIETLANEQRLPLVTDLSSESCEKLKSWNADAVVVVAYGEILSQDILDMYFQKIVNVHASLLPRWRGAAPIQRAVMAKDKETGVSLQVMVKKLDAGDILGERRVALKSSMSALDLHDILQVLGGDLLEIELVQYLKGELKPKPQSSIGVVYAHKIKKAESQINWNLLAQQIYAQFKGLALGAGVFCYKNSKILKIIDMELVLDFSDASEEVGKIIHVDKNSFTVTCKEGALKILEVQPESKSRMSVADFLRGNSISEGEFFE